MKKFIKISLICLLLLGSCSYHNQTKASFLGKGIKTIAGLSIITFISYILLKKFSESGTGTASGNSPVCNTVKKNIDKMFDIDCDHIIEKSRKHAKKIVRTIDKNSKKIWSDIQRALGIKKKGIHIDLQKGKFEVNL